MPEDNIECESFWSFTCMQNKYYLQVYWDNCAYKIIDKQMIDYLNENRFETDEY